MVRRLVVLVALIGVLGWVTMGSAQRVAESERPPEIEAESFLNTDEAPSLADLRGEKVVLVEFWATWCPPCRRSIPHLNELHEAHADDGLVIIGLTDEDRETVEAFMDDGMPMSYIVGTGSGSARAYGVRGIPHAFLLGLDGTVVWQGHPLDPEMPGAIEEALEAAKAS